MPNSPVEMYVRTYENSDLNDILSIEEDVFANPWTEKDFVRILKRKNCVGFVAVADNRVIGYLILEIFKEFFQLLNLAVSTEFQRSRVGTRLLGYIADQLVPTKRKRIITELRESNLVAQLFFQSCRYRATQVLKAQYEDTGEDAFQMEFRLHWPEKVTRQDKKGPFSQVKCQIAD